VLTPVAWGALVFPMSLPAILPSTRNSMPMHPCAHAKTLSVIGIGTPKISPRPLLKHMPVGTSSARYRYMRSGMNLPPSSFIGCVSPL